jgi:hypothetical protein
VDIENKVDDIDCRVKAHEAILKLHDDKIHDHDTKLEHLHIAFIESTAKITEKLYSLEQQTADNKNAYLQGNNLILITLQSVLEQMGRMTTTVLTNEAEVKKNDATNAANVKVKVWGTIAAIFLAIMSWILSKLPIWAGH